MLSNFMIVKTAEFVTSAVKPFQYPDPGPPEIAFAGRSNVGKSSLLNVLVNRKNLVKTSSTPGRTRLVNFFNINDALFFVDLPGYGYANVPASVRKSWGPMIETYLSERKTLKGVIAIVDIRREPRKEELDLLHWLEYHKKKRIIVVTKADKIAKSKQKKRLDLIADSLSVKLSDLTLFSAKTRDGKERVWKAIDSLLSRQFP